MREDVPIVRNFTDTPRFRRQQGKRAAFSVKRRTNTTRCFCLGCSVWHCTCIYMEHEEGWVRCWASGGIDSGAQVSDY